MSFRIAQKPTFVSRVDVETPNNKGGFDSSHFFAEFKRITMEEQAQIAKEKPLEWMPRLIVGFTKLLDGDGNEVEFNEDNLKLLLTIPNAVIALRNTFWDAISKAPQKN